MRISSFIWLDVFIDKLASKHGVDPDEVEELFDNRPFVTRVERGKSQGENLYRALGQTNDGRYPAVFFILKRPRRALVISARGMEPKERREYERNH